MSQFLMGAMVLLGSFFCQAEAVNLVHVDQTVFDLSIKDSGWRTHFQSNQRTNIAARRVFVLEYDSMEIVDPLVALGLWNQVRGDAEKRCSMLGETEKNFLLGAQPPQTQISVSAHVEKLSEPTVDLGYLGLAVHCVIDATFIKNQ